MSRFVMTGNTLGGEAVLINNIPSPAGNHNGGDLRFGTDGLLYVSVGDGGCDYAGGGCAGSNDAARDEHVLLGKILRIDRDGGIPPNNPYQGATDSARCNVTGRTESPKKCRETYAWGLRNPYRIALDPNVSPPTLHINDVGQSTWEEIDLGAPDADYGWNVREGHCATGSTSNCGPPPAGMTNPIFDYGRGDGCVTITGGAFVPLGLWPAEYRGRYLFADFGCGRMWRLEPNGSGGYTRVDFATNLGGFSVVHLAFGPWGSSKALYYTTYANGGQVRRISYTSPATFASAASAPAGSQVSVSAAALPAADVAYVMRMAATSAGCGRGTQVGGPVLADANRNTAVVPVTVPALPPGSYFLCFARLTDASQASPPVAFTIS